MFVCILRLDQGGWITKARNFTFKNVTTKVKFVYDWDVLIEDIDGTLTETPNSVAIYADNITLNNQNCKQNKFFTNGVICSNNSGWTRVTFSSYSYIINNNLVNGGLSIANNQNNTANLHGSYYWDSYWAALDSNQDYTLLSQIKPINISYSGVVYNLPSGNFIIIRHILEKKPDSVTTFGLSTESAIPLSFNQTDSGSWYWENSTKTFR